MTALRRKFPALFALLAALLTPWQPLAHESPVDHVDRAIRIWVENGKVFVRYRIQHTERSATFQLRQMDTDRDGVVTPAERDTYFAAFQKELAAQLKVKLKDAALELKPEGAVEFLPQFKQAFVFSAACPPLERGRHACELLDHYSRSYPGAYRWDEPKGAQKSSTPVIVSEPPKTHTVDGHPSILLIKFEVHVGGRRTLPD